MQNKSQGCGAPLFAAMLAAGVVHAQAQSDANIADMSLEQLSNITITSVSRQEERLSDAPASIFIITASDIRRSGAQSIPEALRLAPNLQVAQIDARNYAITARGFNIALENKLLVMIDGRSVYSPLFSGVFWDVQDVVMEDIERIEVISGPGATIWGANAVNGIINVITRSARDSQGGLASVLGGEHDKSGTTRYGGTLPGDGYYRAYAKYTQMDSTQTAAGVDTVTGWRRNQAGFRADWDQARGSLTWLGDAYSGALGQFGTPDILVSGANMQLRETRKLANDTELRLQAIVDHTERNQPNSFVERLTTLDLEAQQGLQLGQRHHLVWGGGYRYSWDRITNTPNLAFLPGDLNLQWSNLFAQDEIALRSSLKLTAGMKVEHNIYTGAEYLPNARLAWTPDASQLVWTSLSRSVRAPSRIDRDLYAPAEPVLIDGKLRYLIGGGPDFQSEVAKVAELGYRAQPRADLSYSITAYYGKYEGLRTLEPIPLTAASTALDQFQNLGEGNERGVEMWGSWQAAPNWRLNAGLVVQRVSTGLLPDSHDISAASGNSGLAINDPSRHWLLRSSYDVSDHNQLDLTLRYMGSLPNPAVPAYYELDAQWLWKPRPNIELALIGQNLLHAGHPEFAAAPGRSVIQRTGMLKLTLRF